MQVVSSDNNRSLHLGGDDAPLQNSPTDRDISSEWALFVDVVSLYGGGRCLDAQSDILDEAHGLVLVGDGAFAGNENGILFLVCLFVLITLNVFTGDTSHGNESCNQGPKRKVRKANGRMDGGERSSYSQGCYQFPTDDSTQLIILYHRQIVDEAHIHTWLQTELQQVFRAASRWVLPQTLSAARSSKF